MSENSWVSDCDYCGQIKVVVNHEGGKGCQSCIMVPAKSTCIICKGDIDSDIVHDDFNELFEQVDCLGMESATEQEQVVLEGCICSLECYIQLD